MVAPHHRYTLRDYLDIEDASPHVKHEYIDGEIYAMAGGTPEHAALAMAIGTALNMRLRGTPCRAYSSDLMLRIRSVNIATYADVAVVCDPAEHDPESPSFVVNPRVIVEVLSHKTEEYDRGGKRAAYQTLASLREYVLVSQDRRRIEIWSRRGDDWEHAMFEAGAKAPLSSLRIELDVGEIYVFAGVRVA